MLRRIVCRWRDDGHRVEVLSSQPSYKAGLENVRRPKGEHVDGVEVIRLNLPNEVRRPVVRIVNALRLGLALLWRTLSRRYDVIMVSTAPPVLGGAAAALAAKLTGARFIYHCMDIHPEVGRVSGEFAHPFVFGLLRKLDNWSCRRAEPVVVLSADMEATLRERPGGDRLSIAILNNFSLPSEGPIPTESPFEISPDRFTVVFAGNIGRFQGLESVIQAMERLKESDDVEFILMGDGVAKAELEEKARKCGARVRFLGHQPVEVAKAVMREVDAGFVSLLPGMYRYAYPSKTMTYLEQGCPLIVAVEEESELAQDVSNQGYGYAVPVGDSEALARLLAELANDPSWRDEMRAKAQKKAAIDFSEAVMLEKWSSLLLKERERSIQ
ncbi:hypothetical protein KBTX_02540 [wastewater metagenome]|uniref:Glycosyltransferase subfamily 4-like N-terminal domain-containing protein n=3 Tax=root TaxID=1 RepID=A0A5B8RBN6_9ZZZZ|nr:hypothetical protein KBTEX_02540 [uncultured organism]